MQIRQSLDYQLYKIYVWGGLILLVIYIFLATLVFEAHSLPGPQAFLVLGFPLMGWIAGIFLYWWWVFLFKKDKAPEEFAQAQDEGIPGIDSLKSWSTLHQAMAISGGNREELIKNAKKAKLPILLWFGSANLLALWICCPITLGSLEIMHGFRIEYWVGGVFVWVVVMLVGTYFLLGWGGGAGEKAYLAPLGLAITNMPGLKPDAIGIVGGGQQLISDSPSIVEGERNGHLVHIEMLEKRSLVIIQAKFPEFEVHSDEGKLVPKQGAPEQVIAGLKGLRKAKRWQGIQVFAGPQGIGIRRQSKGTNMWLYDLWLAEFLLDKTSIK
jgi:hypothetical protein